MNNVKCAILVRVSTDSQKTERQLLELQQVAKKNNYDVVEVIEETMSGMSRKEDREGLKSIEELATVGAVSKVLVHEVSRVARMPSVGFAFLETLEALGVSLYIHQYGMETLLPNGKRNPSAAILFSVLSVQAREERDTLVDRIRSGQRSSSKFIGRPKGTTMSERELLERHRDIQRLVRRGSSIRHISRIVGKSTTTVQKIKKLMKKEGLLMN